MSNTKYKKAYLVGMPKSGLSPFRRDIIYRYNLELIPYYPYINNASPAINNPNILVICLVKDPYFWYKSLRNDQSQVTTNSDNLLNYLVFNGKGYDNIIELYNLYLKNYLNPSIFKPINSIIIKYEDYLFKFHQTIEYLDTKFLVKNEVGLSLTQNNKENEWFNYQDKYIEEKRYQNISNNDLFKIGEILDNDLLLKFNYSMKKEVIKIFNLTKKNLDLFNKNNKIDQIDKTDTLSQCSKNCQIENIKPKDDDVKENIEIIQNIDNIENIENIDNIENIKKYLEGKLILPKKIKYLDKFDEVSSTQEELTLIYKKAYKINSNIENLLSTNTNC